VDQEDSQGNANAQLLVMVVVHWQNSQKRRRQRFIDEDQP
jgi:hypothetical protein